ncbi:MAG: hypothetical protein XD69_0735 [Clostridia bacterium 62_21]|nr:MAG: hypothetical protein XD69_0735 [Clostridia bacterium 62_21]
MFLGGQKGATAPLVDSIDRAREGWHVALHNFNFAAPDYIDFAVFSISAAECYYTALLQEAKRKGLTAWRDEELVPVATSSPVPGKHREPS